MSARVKLSFSSWFEIFIARSEVNIVLFLRIVELVAPGPVIADSISKDLTVA